MPTKKKSAAKKTAGKSKNTRPNGNHAHGGTYVTPKGNVSRRRASVLVFPPDQ